jgi:hypothetical protein
MGYDGSFERRSQLDRGVPACLSYLSLHSSRFISPEPFPVRTSTEKTDNGKEIDVLGRSFRINIQNDRWKVKMNSAKLWICTLVVWTHDGIFRPVYWRRLKACDQPPSTFSPRFRLSISHSRKISTISGCWRILPPECLRVGMYYQLNS